MYKDMSRYIENTVNGSTIIMLVLFSMADRPVFCLHLLYSRRIFVLILISTAT